MKKPPEKGRKKPVPLPSKEDIVAYVMDHKSGVSKRELIRAFHVHADHRQDFKNILRQMRNDGQIDYSKGRISMPSALPQYTVVTIVEIDVDGEVIARPPNWKKSDGSAPKIYIVPEDKHQAFLNVGEQFLVKLKAMEGLSYEGRVVRRIHQKPQKSVIGVFEKSGSHARIVPIERSQRFTFHTHVDSIDVDEGDLVMAETSHAPKARNREAKIIKKLGHIDDPHVISQMSIYLNDLPHEFSAAAVQQARVAQSPTLGDRTDLRNTPLITIDGEDAKDFDDAVWAEPDPDPHNKGGWHLMVAIADVSHYVTENSDLDKDALERGNSVYFPDQVVPMLPEELSNGLCSLQPDVDRACMAVHMWIDAHGRKLRHKFIRGLMRSHGRWTYRKVQDVIDSTEHHAQITPLYGAYLAMQQAREKRGTLEINLPEQQIIFDDKGQVENVISRPRWDSHQLIEEFMILANVCAAEELEKHQALCMYRVHDTPPQEAVRSLQEFLGGMNINFAKGQVIQPAMFTQVLRKVKDTPQEMLVNDLVLRSQSQAVYSPGNLGHFGLALTKYAHFTSPIRRYSDLLVHRSLIAALKLGKDGLKDFRATPENVGKWERLGTHISGTERRAVAAERDARNRFMAMFLSQETGKHFDGRITGVTRFGLFIRLTNSGAEGFIPMRNLPPDYWVHHDKQHQLVGRRSGYVFTLADLVTVTLAKAAALTGEIQLDLYDHTPANPGGKRPTGTGQDRPKKYGKKPGKPGKKGKKPHQRRK